MYEPGAPRSSIGCFVPGVGMALASPPGDSPMRFPPDRLGSRRTKGRTNATGETRMAKDMSDTVRDALGQVVREAVKNVGSSSQPQKRSSPLSGARGVAAGAGKAAKKMGDQVGGKLKEGVSEKVDEAGGAGGLVKEAASGLMPGGGDSGGGKGGMPGVGKGRRMPVQQSMDVAVPVETAYNQWTQFEDWPEFMHRVTRVTQDDPCTVSFATKIWGKTKEFVAEIETQRLDARTVTDQVISQEGIYERPGTVRTAKA